MRENRTHWRNQRKLGEEESENANWVLGREAPQSSEYATLLRGGRILVVELLSTPDNFARSKKLCLAA